MTKWFYRGRWGVPWRRRLLRLRSGQANKDTRGVPGTGKFCLRRVLVAGLDSRLSDYAASHRSIRHATYDLALAASRCTGVMRPR